MSGSARWFAACATVAALAALARPAEAHTLGLSRTEWRVDGGDVVLRMELVRADALALAPAADVNGDGELSAEEAQSAAVAERALAGHVRVEAAGTACALERAALELDDEDGALLEGRYVCPEGDRRADLGRFFGALPAGHRQAAFVHRSDAAPEEALLHAKSAELSLGRAGSAPSPSSSLEVARDYVVLGVEHIWFGIDHLVFLIGLVLAPSRPRDVLTMATAFTVAHSVTLALAVVGLVTPSGAIIEPLIALSVAYVGVENLRGVEASRRWRLTAAFGLVHGFGFAGAIADVGMPQDRLPLALFTFNLGVELGQLAILAVVVPVVGWLHATRWFRERGVRALSAALVGLGLVWFVQRVL